MRCSSSVLRSKKSTKTRTDAITHEKDSAQAIQATSRTLLEAAARDDRLLLEKALSTELGYLEHDDINQALLRAAQNGNGECVERLLAEGAEMDCDDADGDTPLMLAAANDHIGVVRLLLQYGCDVDLQSDRDRSTLHMAVWNRCIRIVQLLIDIGCEVNFQERYGDTPLMLAARRGYADVMTVLLQRQDVDINVRSFEKDTALHYAARNGHPDCLRLMLEKKCELEPTTLWGHTPLLFTAMNGHCECAKLLLEAGADHNVKDRSLKSTLHYFAKKDDFCNLTYILKHGGSPNVLDSDGNTPLSDAVLHGNTQTVKVLIQYGCNVHPVGKYTLKGKFSFCTPLEVALHQADIQTASVLVAAEASARDLRVFCDNHPDIVFEDHVYPWIVDTLSDPPPLQAICRCALRDILQNKLLEKAEALPLPPALKAYVSFADILDDVN